MVLSASGVTSGGVSLKKRKTTNNDDSQGSFERASASGLEKCTSGVESGFITKPQEAYNSSSMDDSMALSASGVSQSLFGRSKSLTKSGRKQVRKSSLKRKGAKEEPNSASIKRKNRKPGE